MAGRTTYSGVRDIEVTPRREVTTGLYAPGWLATHPGIGLFLTILGVLVFAFLAYELRTNGRVVKFDTQLAASMHETAVKAPGMINELMTFGFFLGKENLQLLGTVLVVYFLYKRFWAELGMVLIGWGGGSLIWTQLIYYFNRPRPNEQLGLEVRIPSFPSGHTMFVTLALGLLAYLLVPKMPSRFWKWVMALGILLLILFVGFSRLFQGGHYLSDVIAGYAVGLVWGTVVYTALESVAIRRRV